MFGFETEVGQLVDDGILKETASRTMLFGTRELAPTHFRDGLTELLGGVVRQTFESFVTEVGGEGFAEAVGDAKDEIASREMLEKGVAVSKMAISIAEGAMATFLEVVSLDALDKILCLSTVCTYVLHCRGAHGAGDSR